MDKQLNLPERALVDKFIAKERFYEKDLINSKLRFDFQEFVQKITWKYKLSERTIGVDKTKKIDEIQIFQIELKKKEVPINVVEIINKLIPYPILYVFVNQDSYCYGIRSVDGANYYLSAWDKDIDFNFEGLNLEKVYQNIVREFITKIDKEDKDFDKLIETDNRVKNLEAEIEKLKRKVRREKQFNRKVEINRLLNVKQEEYNKLVINN